MRVNGRRRRLLTLLVAASLLILPALSASAKGPSWLNPSSNGVTELHGPHQGVFSCPDGGSWHFVLNQVSPSITKAGTITAEFSNSGTVTAQADKVLRTVRHFNIEGAGTLITASVDIGGAMLVLSDFECDGRPPPSPVFCAGIEVDILVEFDGSKIGNTAELSSLPLTTSASVDIPAGTYEVLLGSSDSPHPEGQMQDHEQWRAIFNSTPEAASEFSEDIADDGSYTAGDVLESSGGTVTLETDVTMLTAEHWAATQSGSTTPDSVIPECVGLSTTSS